MAFIQSQTDYITFLYGLIFIILGGIALIQKFIGHSRIKWICLAIFGVLHGLHEWIDIPEAAFPQLTAIDAVADLVGLASFVALIEFARVNWQAREFEHAGEAAAAPHASLLRRHWPAAALLLCGVALSVLEMSSTLHSVTHIAALTGGVWAAVTLGIESRHAADRAQRRWLLLAAAALGAFSLGESVFSMLIRSQMFSLVTTTSVGMQIALLDATHTLFAALTTLAVWRYIQRSRGVENAASEADTSNLHYSLWLSSSLILVLAIGWFATDQLGHSAESSVRDRSRGATEILASHLRDEMARTDLMAALLAKSPYVLAGLEQRDPASLAAAEAAMRQHTAVLESSIAFLMAPNGNVLAATGDARQSQRRGESFGFLPYFQDSSAYGLVGKDLAVEPDLVQRGYYVSHPVTNAAGEAVGVAVVKKVLAQTDKEFKRFRDWFLVNPSGVIFLSSRPEFLLQPLWPLAESSRQQLVRSRELGPGPFTGALLERLPADRATVSWENRPALANLVPVRADGWSAVIIENLDTVAVQRLYGILATAAVALFTLCFFVVVQRETAYEFRLAVDQQRLQALNAELERQATTDNLTGLYNRLKFNILLVAEIDRANRYGSSFTLVMMDVDHFKQVNDNYGHQAGDNVLIDLARLARDTMRSSDALARWGGEEFIAILPMTDVNGAMNFTERVRRALAGFAFEPVPKVTCSFGITEFMPGDTPESMTQRADTALYLAKERGRNRTEVNLTDAA